MDWGLTERCSSLQGFLIFHSFGGGTGRSISFWKLILHFFLYFQWFRIARNGETVCGLWKEGQTGVLRLSCSADFYLWAAFQWTSFKPHTHSTIFDNGHLIICFCEPAFSRRVFPSYMDNSKLQQWSSHIIPFSPLTRPSNIPIVRSWWITRPFMRYPRTIWALRGTVALSIDW